MISEIDGLRRFAVESVADLSHGPPIPINGRSHDGLGDMVQGLAGLDLFHRAVAFLLGTREAFERFVDRFLPAFALGAVLVTERCAGQLSQSSYI